MAKSFREQTKVLAKEHFFQLFLTKFSANRELEGIRDKSFCIMDQNADDVESHHFFDELFGAGKNNFACIYDKDSPPEKIRTLVKQYSDIFYEDLYCCIQDYIGVRILNQFGVQSSFDTGVPVKDSNGNELMYLLSVDWKNDDEKFFPCDELKNMWQFDDDNMLSYLQNKPKMIEDLTSIGANLTKEDLKNFVEDYARQYLVRTLVLHDADAYIHNFGIILSKDKRVRVSPAFDLEYALSKHQFYDIEDIIPKCYESPTFTHIFLDVFKTANEKFNDGTFQKIVSEAVERGLYPGLYFKDNNYGKPVEAYGEDGYLEYMKRLEMNIRKMNKIVSDLSYPHSKEHKIARENNDSPPKFYDMKEEYQM